MNRARRAGGGGQAMRGDLRDSTVALAGIFQAADLVRQIAHEGRAQEEPFRASIGSIFELDPRDVSSVYGGLQGVGLGMRILHEQFSDSYGRRDFEVTKYVVSAMHLERRLMKDRVMVEKIRADIKRIRGQAEHFSIVHENVIAALAQVYVETISTLAPRIIVSGDQGHLMVAGNAEKVRALLLAAIRAAVLWRQCGGNRWQLLFGRRRVAQASKELIV